MNEFDVAGLLRTYAEVVRYSRDTHHMKELIRRLKKELDLRKVQHTKDQAKAPNLRRNMMTHQ